MVTPLFILLIFGIIDFGLLMRSSINLNSATIAGARAASVGRNNPSADFMVLQSVSHSIGSHGIESVNSIVVYKADGPDGKIPPACRTNPVATTASCNRYSVADMFKPYSDGSGERTGFWGCEPSALDGNWCPMSRNTDIASSTGPDYVGVHIEFEHTLATGFFGARRRFSDYAVIQLEPKRPTP